MHLAQDSVAGSSKHGNEPSGGNFLTSKGTVVPVL